MTVNPNPHEGELRDIREQQARNETALQKRLDEAGKSASAELKARQAALDKALKEARESKAAMAGELKRSSMLLKPVGLYFMSCSVHTLCPYRGQFGYRKLLYVKGILWGYSGISVRYAWLKRSIKAFGAGLPGLINSSIILCSSAYSARVSEIHPDPLSRFDVQFKFTHQQVDKR